jgi:anti-sigma factor RsiW
MRNHVSHLLTAYVHGQLSRSERERIAVHVRLCDQCRAALNQERQTAREIAMYMPLVGQPKRSQLARLWPAIWMEFRTPQRRIIRWLPSYGVVLMLILLCAFVLSSLFGGPTHAIAAPFQAVPAEVKATSTPAGTDEPTTSLQPSETASVSFLVLASPAPHAGPLSPSGGLP